MNLEKLKKKIQEANPDRFVIPEDLPLPVKYDGMCYYWGKSGEMVADFDSGVNTGDGFRIRGWGRIKNEENQDACARYIEKAINTHSEIGLADVLLAINKAMADGESIKVRDRFIEEIIILQKWNLSNDNLDNQSEETINFLYELLCKTY